MSPTDHPTEPMTRSAFEAALAAHYGTDVAGLYLHVTGKPMWLDYGAPGQRAAAAKWEAFVDDCAARIEAAAKAAGVLS